MFTHCELVIVTLALTLYGQAQAGQIVGGHEAVPHSRPYMVLLEQPTEDGGTKFCGGFLLNEDFVMTAAHCQARSYKVLLGYHNIHDPIGTQNASVKQAFPHQGYNASSLRNDIMLLKLSSKAKFNKNVKPIDLASLSDDAPKSCLVSGWGARGGEENYMSDVLMEVNVILSDNENCRKANMYCSDGKTGPNIGDSGGPLVCENGKAYGVVSHSYTIDSNGKEIKFYAKIAEHRNWIKQRIRDA